MNPKQFLLLGGAVLVLVAILGYIGVIGPTPDQSLFGEAWYFDNGENIAHLVLGAIALAAVYLADTKTQKLLVQVVAVVAIFFGLYGFVAGPGPNNAFGLANLENPLDNILHLGIGAWAAYASWMSKG
ncbi:DUF4383 domain-containing protein [Candidatus Curtissbacteria bacterium]|nr:DUF4383 domain-containing protein [Candidatus Curtissbacteria bacterium]